MLQFLKLRLAGFKSFVDPAELLIEPGLTGIVGPNGCGKSNLVEALRWVMGETSARQMRGGEMDDVIFGGSASRPRRDLAEVTLVLDNSFRSAPPQFNAWDELEVARRIERGEGSVYRVNGKEVRARDVQLLFADSATGARSPAIVSQGRIGSIINAKPAERRALLEEAAGIGGLHSRRHEAELRLRGAETNLGRVEDVLTALDGQLQGLKRQARQAARYRNVSDAIRDSEALLLHLRWLAALLGLEDARAAAREAEAAVARLTAAAAEAAVRQTEAAAGLPSLRQAEAEAAAKFQRLVVAREQLDAEEGRVASARREAEQRLAEIDADARREAARAADAEQALARLEGEDTALRAAQDGEEEALAVAGARVDAAEAAAEAADAEVTRLTQRLAASEAERAAAARRLAEAEGRRARLAERLVQAEAQFARAEAEKVAEEEVLEAQLRLEEASEGLEQAREALATAEATAREARAAREAARDAVQAEAAALARLRAEEGALVEVLAVGDGSGYPPVIDAVLVEPGFEAALAVALGEDLSAPADTPQASVNWRSLPPLKAPPPLPAGVEPLADLVTAPPALARRLSQIGVVFDAAAGGDLSTELAPGQRLVTPDGDLWRWDGFTVAAGAPTPAAVRLRQRNRLEELRQLVADARRRLDTVEENLAAAGEASDAAAAAEASARERARQAEAALTQVRQAHERLARKAAEAAARLGALAETAERLRNDLAEAEAEEAAARAVLTGGDELAGLRALAAQARAEAAERRAALLDARSALDRLRREAAERRRRLEALADDAASWRERLAAARGQAEELQARRETVLAELEALAQRPLEIAEQRAALLESLETADGERAAAAAALAAAEARQGEAARMLRDVEQELAGAREDRVRREAAVEAAGAVCRQVAQRIAERLDCTPERLAEQLGDRLREGEPPAVAELEARLERLMRERDGMGPVNLRAETEAAELERQMEQLRTERADLLAAIGKLRQAIAEINREGRERLVASFEDVDRHFRDLFVRLFGGGRAHLELVESADPLEAGLEIMASPPGKRLQVLSLLSGGEQALTALALLFAVFMTNPAPICVLDEVDAPLDDANVDRVCTLLEEIARSSRTRFLVVTHHRMTMARMDRLFGVTMAERGVSRLVSVDLRAAEELRQTAQ